MVDLRRGIVPRNQQAPAFVDALLLNLPPLRDEHVNTPGFYVAATQLDPYVPWRGYGLFESSNPDSEYVPIGTFSDRAIVGQALTLPANSSLVSHQYIDRLSTVDVEILDDVSTLESVSEADMLRGRNRFLLGKEIIGAATCSLVTANQYTGRRTYRLSTLLRGVKDTFVEMDSHRKYERCLQLDGPGLYFIAHAAARVDEQRYFKAVPGGGILTDFDPINFVSTGQTARAFRPVCIAASRDGSNNLTVTWQPQSRRAVQALDQGVAIDEPTEQVKIFVLASPGASTALRSTTVTGARSWTYTFGQQLTDSITPGDPVTLELRTIGAVLLDGNSTEVTV